MRILLFRGEKAKEEGRGGHNDYVRRPLARVRSDNISTPNSHRGLDFAEQRGGGCFTARTLAPRTARANTTNARSLGPQFLSPKPHTFSGRMQELSLSKQTHQRRHLVFPQPERLTVFFFPI